MMNRKQTTAILYIIHTSIIDKPNGNEYVFLPENILFSFAICLHCPETRFDTRSTTHIYVLLKSATIHIINTVCKSRNLVKKTVSFLTFFSSIECKSMKEQESFFFLLKIKKDTYAVRIKIVTHYRGTIFLYIYIKQILIVYARKNKIVRLCACKTNDEKKTV